MIEETLNYNNNVNVDDISDNETINYTDKNPPKQQKSILQIQTKSIKKKYQTFKKKNCQQQTKKY